MSFKLWISFCYHERYDQVIFGFFKEKSVIARNDTFMISDSLGQNLISSC